MSPLPVRPGNALLRCPLCRLELSAAAGALACRNRHSFDISRDGYVNLLTGRRVRAAAGGDTTEQSRHRASLLGAGHFDFIADAIAERARELAARRRRDEIRILDAGCGTGHHLARLAEKFPHGLGLGIDISKEAARQAARRWRTHAFAVADLWAAWPVQDTALDLVISIFAPKNFAETARVLRPGGGFAIAYPGSHHLVELADRFGLMRRHGDKTRHYREAAEHHIGRSTIERLRRAAVLDAATVRSLVLMGPNARHIAPARLDGATAPLSVTFDILLVYARKSAANARSKL